MVESVCYVTNVLFLLQMIQMIQMYHLISSIICCLFLELYNLLLFFLSSSIISVSFVTIPEFFWSQVFQTIVILPPVVFPIKSSVVSAVFYAALFELVLNANVADYLIWSKSFWMYLPLKFLLILLPIFFDHNFSKRKIITLYKYSIFRFNWITSRFLYVISLIITKLTLFYL